MLFLKIVAGWVGLSNVILANQSGYREEENTTGLTRVKRDTTDWQNIVVDLAIGTVLTGSADLGDSYVFTLRLQLPAVSSLSPLSVLISGTDPEAGTSSIHLCSPTITKLGETVTITRHQARPEFHCNSSLLARSPSVTAPSRTRAVPSWSSDPQTRPSHKKPFLTLVN